LHMPPSAGKRNIQETLCLIMRNTLITLLIISLTSCNQLVKEVEDSFVLMGLKMDSLNKIEVHKIEKHFNEINSKQIKKIDSENSALIYYSIIEHNRIADSLINELNLIGENKKIKKTITERFEFSKSDLKNKLNSIKEFNTKIEIDSLLKPSNDLESLPNFALVTNLKNGKLDASKGAELILNKIKNKTLNKDIFNVYDISSELLKKLFDKKLRFVDIKRGNKNIPQYLNAFNKSFNNARLYFDIDYKDDVASKFYENYSLIIIEYFSNSMAEKSLLQFIRDNEKITKPISLDSELAKNKRIFTISQNSKYGGLVFYKSKYLISVVKKCNPPNTLKKMNWEDYANTFINKFLNDKDHNIVLNAKCGSFKYEYIKFKSKKTKHNTM